MDDRNMGPGADGGAGRARINMIAEVRRYVGETLGITDEAEMKDFLDTFMQSFGECVKELRALGNPPDVQVIRVVTHKIYGFARSIGAMELNDAALLLNVAAKQNDPDACAAGIRLVLALYEGCLADS